MIQDRTGIEMKKRIKNWLIFVAVVTVMGLLRCLSLSFSLRIGRWLGRCAFRISKRDREVTLSSLHLAFVDKLPAELKRLGVSVFEHLGMAATECVNIRKIRDLSGFMNLTPESRSVLEDTLAQGKGVVFVTAHCGNWELMARALAELGYPINTIGKKSYDPRFTRMMELFRKEAGVRTIWRGQAGVMKDMRDVLRRGEIMGLLIDQDTRVPGVFVPFFGKQAFTSTAPAYLARRAQAPIVCGFNHRCQSVGYRIEIEPFELSTDSDQETAILQDTARLSARIEQHIRENPAEWVWMHRRWKTRPAVMDDNNLQARDLVI